MKTIHYETVVSDLLEDGIRSVTLNRPDSLNAMNPALIRDTAVAFSDANEDNQTRVILFTGAGRAFCAGDDRKAHQHPENRADAEQVVAAIQRVTREITLGKKPVVGAINGWAVGGGFEWALNTDFSIWAKSAKAFFPEVSLNLFVTGGVTSLLPAMVGLTKAREMLMLGEKYTADELLDLGIAWRVVEEEALMASALTLARRLAAQPELAIRSMKKVLNHTAQQSILEAMTHETNATVDGFMDPLTTKLLKDF